LTFFDTLKTSAAALCLAGLSAPAMAQDAAPAAPQQEATQETREHAVRNLRLLMGGLSSEDVEQRAKDVLVGCIFRNSLRSITEAMDQAIANNPGEIDRADDSQMLGLMAGICGFRPEQAAQPAQ
jgi:hypothetical protein